MLQSDEIAFLVVYVLFMVLITFGNMVVIVIVIHKSDLKSSKNLHLISLACSDFIVGALLIPNVITMRYSKMDWGKPWCLICLYMEHVASAACMLTITAMAIDRFQLLAYPLKFRTNKIQIVYASIALVWLTSLLYALRVPLIFDVNTKVRIAGNLTTNKFSCTVRDSSDVSHRIVTVVDFFILFLLPATVLTATNVIVSFKLTRSNVTAASKTGMEKRKKAIRILLVMAVIFVVCHVPSFAARLHKTAVDKKMKNYKYIGMSFQVISWCNSLINVFFYGSLNDEVKEVMSKISNFLRKFCICGCNKNLSRVRPASQMSSTRSGSNTKTFTTATSNVITVSANVDRPEGNGSKANVTDKEVTDRKK